MVASDTRVRSSNPVVGHFKNVFSFLTVGTSRSRNNKKNSSTMISMVSWCRGREKVVHSEALMLSPEKGLTYKFSETELILFILLSSKASPPTVKHKGGPSWHRSEKGKS